MDGNASIAPVDNVKQNDVILTGTPTEIIEQSTQIANILKDIINKQQLFQKIQGNKYVTVEGWTTLSSILQLVPLISNCERLDREDEIIYEAYCEVYTANNRLVSQASAICSNKERNWRNRDEYAIRSMAQTRAISKALRLPLGWIMTLADFTPTPLEEMSDVDFKSNKKPARQTRPTQKPKPTRTAKPTKDTTVSDSKLPPKENRNVERVTKNGRVSKEAVNEDFTLSPSLEQEGRKIGMIDRIFENCEIEGTARPTYLELCDLVNAKINTKNKVEALKWLESIK